jgi:NAD(P)-dependent dehydrogenase (short-subunit alcohol dehydrogenase family)
LDRPTDNRAGIGYAVSEALVENGCKVIVSSSNPSRVEQTVQKLQKAYPSSSSNVSGHVCNLGDESKLEQNIVELFEKTGKVDHIIYTAADALAQMPLDTIDLEKIKKAGMLRFFGPLLVGKHAKKYLTPGPKSSITLTTGGVSQKPIPDWTVIGSYATALHGLTRGLALDLKPIRVNLVSPGAVDTGT